MTEFGRENQKYLTVAILTLALKCLSVTLRVSAEILAE